MFKKIGSLALLVLPFASQATTFLLWEQSGKAVGNYGASGAVTDDSSIAWYNPAGLTALKNKQISVSALGAYAKQEYTGEVDLSPAVADYTNKSGYAKSSGFGAFGTAFFSMPINENLAAGFHMTVPYAYEYDFSRDSFARYAGLNGSLAVVDIGPSLGYQLTKDLSVGAGINWQQLKLESQTIVAEGTIAYDSLSRVKLESDTFGWNIGALWKPRADTRIGLAYHSIMIHESSGKSTFQGPGPPHLNCLSY